MGKKSCLNCKIDDVRMSYILKTLTIFVIVLAINLTTNDEATHGTWPMKSMHNQPSACSAVLASRIHTQLRQKKKKEKAKLPPRPICHHRQHQARHHALKKMGSSSATTTLLRMTSLPLPKWRYGPLYSTMRGTRSACKLSHVICYIWLKNQIDKQFVIIMKYMSLKLC